MSRKAYTVALPYRPESVRRPVNFGDVHDILIDSEFEEKNTWLMYAKLILPHVGLIILSCLYVLSGAAVFYHLERPYEVETRKTNLRIINEEKTNFLEKLWATADVGYNVEQWRKLASDDIENLTQVLFNAFDTHYIEDRHLNNSRGGYQEGDIWTFAAAVFFTSTLLTTIGYGNLVPVTFEGRVFCICYGLFGVPLILITVTDIGKFLAEHITSSYVRFIKWKRSSGFLTRIRNVSRRRWQETNNNNNNDNNNSMTNELQKLGLGFVNIPTPLILAILLGYMALGALLLSFLEDWKFFDAFYFSFVTMTTVGFGDLVPENQNYFLLDLLYIVVGLAITTMCIDLVGARYIEKIHYFGMAIKDARVALVNVGGKMVQVGDLRKYATFLHRKYGLSGSREGSRNFANRFPDAFTPREIKGIRYIDFVSSSESLHSYHSKSVEEDEEDIRWRATYGLE